MKLERKKWKMLKKRGRSLLATQLWNFVREKGGKESLPSQSREFMLFTWRTINHPGDKPRLALPLQNYQCVFSERNPLHTAGCSLQLAEASFCRMRHSSSLCLLEVPPILLELLGPNASPSLVLLVSSRVPWLECYHRNGIFPLASNYRSVKWSRSVLSDSLWPHGL